jgi:hypothetical protein
MLYPQGILYNKQDGVVRTLKVNSLFVEIEPLVRLLEEN